MASEPNETNKAAEGTEKSQLAGEQCIPSGEGECPTWKKLGTPDQLPPFFNPTEEIKRSGFQVKFLADDPRRERESPFTGNQELWFDIEDEGQVKTWTISQISLLMELKKHAPLKGKSFKVQLVPVDEKFKKVRPKYRGKDRYVVTPVKGDTEQPSPAPAVVEEVVADQSTDQP